MGKERRPVCQFSEKWAWKEGAGNAARRTTSRSVAALSLAGLDEGAGRVGPIARAATAARTIPDTAVILVDCSGGPSHLETYDLKPEGAAESRSAFRPVPTVVLGMSVCERLPLHARVADRFSLVRSLHHTGRGRSLGRQSARPAGTTRNAQPPSKRERPTMNTHPLADTAEYPAWSLPTGWGACGWEGNRGRCAPGYGGVESP